MIRLGFKKIQELLHLYDHASAYYFTSRNLAVQHTSLSVRDSMTLFPFGLHGPGPASADS